MKTFLRTVAVFFALSMIFQVSTKAQVENSQASEKSNFDYIEEIVDQVFTSDKYKVFSFDGVICLKNLSRCSSKNLRVAISRTFLIM